MSTPVGFDRLCREALPHLYQKDAIHAGFRIGEYWDKQVQIDVVAVRDDSWIDLGECKWGPVGSAPMLVAELDTKVRAFPNRGAHTISRRLFARSLSSSMRRRTTGAPVRSHSLEELYEP